MLDNLKGGNKPKSTRIKFEMSKTTQLVIENEYCKIYYDKRSGKTFKVVNDEVVPLDQRELNMWKNRQKRPREFAIDVIKDENGNVYDYVISKVTANETAESDSQPAVQRPAAANIPPAPVAQRSAAADIPPAPAAQRPAAANIPPASAAQRPAAAHIPPTPAAQRPAAANIPPAPAAQRPAAANIPPTPAAQRPVAAIPSAPAAQRPAAKQSAAPSVITTTGGTKPSRVKFEQTPTTELILENEFFKLYKDSRSGKTFKVINGEVAPLDQRELNMWKNRLKTPQNFTVEILKDSSGEIYEYHISRRAAPSADLSVEEYDTPAPAAQAVPAPIQNKPAAAPANVSINIKKEEPAAQPVSTAVKSVPAAAPQIPVPQKQSPSAKSIPRETSEVGTAPTNRVGFEQTPTTEMVVENEYCKIYKDTRSGKTFKVINGMIAPIELRELNMWKNRQKTPRNFQVKIMKDQSGKAYDYIISRINDDGTLTEAPPVAPVMPYIPPENEYVPSDTLSNAAPKKTAPTRPSQVFPTGAPAGAPPVRDSKTKGPDVNDRITFEETPTMYVVIENEFFKIYNDSRRGKTFKVINGKIAPVELREVNMWKNRQLKPKNFAVEVVKMPSGEVYDYTITRTEKSTTAAVESTSKKTNMPPVTDTPNSNVAAKKRRPNASRLAKCAICGNEFNESELLLFDNRNFCSACVENLIKEKLEFKPVDPIQKIIDDVVGADEIYCTYSTVTNYPYLDEEFCVNVCTVKKAAKVMDEQTAVQTIDDKGMFFDDLKRFGLKKIIVNNDTSHVFAPQDFDEHVKTEGVIAPKLYFKVLNFMQRNDDELRETIAASFLGSTVYTFALNDDITEIAEENIEDFKPLIISDGNAKFCPVFTDFTEARSVGMPFRGLYQIETRLLVDYDITHFIINPSSLGFIMNKTILDGVEPNYDHDLVDDDEIERLIALRAEAARKAAEEEAARKAAEEEAARKAAEEEAARKAAEEEAARKAAEEEAARKAAEEEAARKAAEEEAARKAELEAKIRAEEEARIKAEAEAKKSKDGSPEIVVRSSDANGNATQKTFKVSMPIFIPDDPSLDVDASTASAPSWKNAIKKPSSGYSSVYGNSSGIYGSSQSSYSSQGSYAAQPQRNEYKPVEEKTPAPAPAPVSPASSAPSGGMTFDDLMNGMDSDSDSMLDLSSLMSAVRNEPTAPPPPPKPKQTIQQQATKTKIIGQELEVEADVRVAQIYRDQLNESYKELSRMIAEADVMYAEFDANTKHILIDGKNRGHIFSEKVYAEKSVENFAKNGINAYIKEYTHDQLYPMLFEYKRHGIQDLVLDETANWVIISTETIIDMMDVNDREFVKIPVTNPELMFSMTTLFQKLKSKSDNPNRKQEIGVLERRMIREFTSARYILPLVSSNQGEPRPLTIEKNGMTRVLVFSDVFEIKRFFGDKSSFVKDYEILTYKEIIKRYTVAQNTVVVLNEGSLRFEFNDHNCDHINKIVSQ